MPVARSRGRQVGSFVVGIALFWAALYFYVPTLAVHARSLGASDTVVGLIVGSYGFTQLIVRVPLGIASDRLGRRKVFVLLGLLTIAVSSIGLALAPSPAHMLLARGLAGVAASTWVASTVLFSAFYPPSEAVRSTSLMSLSSSLGQMLATFAGGYVAARHGTGSPFWVAAFVAFVGFLVLLPVAEPAAAQRRTPPLGEIAGVLTLPSLLLISLAAAAAQYAAFATSYAFVPIFADEVLHLDSAQIGTLTSMVLLPYALMTTMVAGLSTRVSERRLVTVGLCLLAVATTVVPFTVGFWSLLVSRILFGLGMGLTYPVLMGLSIKSVPQEQRASAMGAFQAIYALGMTAGPAISGLIADQFSLTSVFWVTAAACLLGLPLVHLSERPRLSQAAKSPAR
ncbi:MAG: MFS transporter [Anaerolineae bacterium]|nr:MFS transporter [Anaerolineae bacterium]